MSRPDKKQRHKAKREAKRRAVRQRESISPVKRLAGANGEIEYWMSRQMDSLGQTQIFVYKRAAGLSGLTCFLIDRGVVGLKDTFTRMHLDRADFQRALDECAGRNIPMHRATVEEVRRCVAGGIRWAYDNGMRLPKDWEKHASLIGGVGDWRTADVSNFVKEFCGHPDDLRQRLISEPFDTYIQREDIFFEFSEDAPYMDQKTGRYSDEHGDSDFEEDTDEEDLLSAAQDIPDEKIDKVVDRFVPAATALADQTEKWLASRNTLSSPELFEAWRSVIVSSLLSKLAMPKAPEQEVADFGYELLENMDRRIETSRFGEYRRAVGQALEHLQSDPKLMEEAVLKHGMVGESGK